ncbi:MAG: chorismate-binding protein [Mariprofundaceae bacterium]|nr:chorismate-binding protein [Mariprofundaceae bacterium]
MDSSIKNKSPLFTRTLQRTLHAHEVFFSFSEQCAAILEDPKGRGYQFIVSKKGHTTWLNNPADADIFFTSWQSKLTKKDIDFPAIQHLVYASYEVSTLLEHLPQPKSRPPAGLLCLHEPDWSLCFQPEDKKVHLASILGETHLDVLEAMLEKTSSIFNAMSSAPLPFNISVDESGESDYSESVERVKQYIASGDVFQVNIARFWQSTFPKESLLDLYAQLRKVNSAPFACFVQLDNFTLISSSPERLFSLSKEGIAETRPIAGTRKRSLGDADQDLHDELLLSDKERAEHIMLVDLERNDLGRVCQSGSIEVNEFMAVEKYPTVQHIVSNIRGKLDEKYDVVDLFRAMFPGGTITGCPKVRCMEIIHEMEHQARGPYTGSLGYIAWDGSADFNIIIRSFWHTNNHLHWAAGAGIVADSNPQSEKNETEHKAAGLLRALSSSHTYCHIAACSKTLT